MNQLEVSNVPIWPIYHLARRVEGKKAPFVATQRAHSTPLTLVLFPTCNSTGSGHCFHRRNSSHLHARWRRVRLEGWWWWRWCGRKKGGKCPRRRMDHHYSLTGKITSPGTGSEAICMMDQERKRQCHGVKYGGGRGQESSANWQRRR